MFQGVQSPWPRPNPSIRSPASAAIASAAGPRSAPDGIDAGARVVPPAAQPQRLATDRPAERQLVGGVAGRIGRPHRRAADQRLDHGQRVALPLLGVQQPRDPERARRGGPGGDAAKRLGLGGDERAGELVPADLRIGQHAPARRGHLHHRLAVRPGRADAHRQLDLAAAEHGGEVVAQHEIGQLGVGDLGRDPHAEPASAQPLGRLRCEARRRSPRLRSGPHDRASAGTGVPPRPPGRATWPGSAGPGGAATAAPHSGRRA